MSKVEISSITHCIDETPESTRRSCGNNSFAHWESRYATGLYAVEPSPCGGIHFIFSVVANPFLSYNKFRFEKCCFHLSQPSEFGERSLHHPSSFCNSIVPAWRISVISRNQDYYWLHDIRLHHLAIQLRSIFPPV